MQIYKIFVSCRKFKSMGQKIVVGITQGDTNGIGYEVIIKALSDARMLDSMTPVVYGSSRFFGIYRKLIPEMEQLPTNIINSVEEARPKRINIINAVPDSLSIDIGQPTLDGAKAAIDSLKAAVADAKRGALDAIVTAPFNKRMVAEAGFGFPGHTEFFISQFEAKDGLMLLCSDTFKVGILTSHLPISKVSSAITKENILSKLRTMSCSLRSDFGIDRPKIAVLGLNPHAGDGGALGDEEVKIIIPAIEAAGAEGILAFGPYPPDGFFGTFSQKKFDGVLAMYHDQGLIPFKTLVFDEGVNYTAGIPFVRTSPDHGTGYDIAGKGLAHPNSMRTAIHYAVDIVKNRNEFMELVSNPLEIKHFEGPKYERTIMPE